MDKRIEQLGESVLTAPDAAKVIGCTKQNVYLLMQTWTKNPNAGIPYYMIGGVRMLLKSDVKGYIKKKELSNVSGRSNKAKEAWGNA